MAQTTPEQKVLVIGAGIGGLLLAQGLKKEGIPCTVYEAEPSASHYRPREWGMSVQWGWPMLRKCFTEEKFNRVFEAAVDPNFEPPDPGIMPTWNGGTGEFIKNIPLLRMIRVSRRRFRAFCAEGIDIQYGKTIDKISYSSDSTTPPTVTAHFKDGTTAAGTLLVGADGSHSAVRRSLFPGEAGEAKRVPYAALNLHVKYNDAEKARFIRSKHPIMYHAVHPAGYWLFIAIQEVPDPEKPETWTFQLQTTWKKPDNPEGELRKNGIVERGDDEYITDLAAHKKRAETFGEPFKSANLWIPEGTKLYSNRLSYWNPMEWDTKGGRVAILGDAAHPMTFQRGQGLNHGIADAANLTELLAAAKAGTKTQEAAVAEYMAEMVPRAGEEVKVSLLNTQMLHDWDRVQDSPFLKSGGVANVKLADQKTETEKAKDSVPDATVNK